MSAIEGFALRKGDSYNWKVEFDDGETPPGPINIAGYTLTFTVKTNIEDTDANAIFQVPVTFPDDADSQAGIGWIFIPHTETAKLTPGIKVYYDFQLSFVDSLNRKNSNTMAAGIVKVDWEVTQTVP